MTTGYSRKDIALKYSYLANPQNKKYLTCNHAYFKCALRQSHTCLHFAPKFQKAFVLKCSPHFTNIGPRVQLHFDYTRLTSSKNINNKK